MPVADPRPWFTGPNGATNVTRAEMQRRAREVLESVDYQDSLMRRIRNDELAPAVETMLYAYAYGKPIEQVNLNVSTGLNDLSHCSTDELASIAGEALKQLEEVRAVEKSIPAEWTTPSSKDSKVA